MDFISLHDAVMVLGPPRNRCIYIEVNRSTPTNLHQKWNENEMVLQQQGVNFYAITTLMFFFLLFSNNFANYIHSPSSILLAILWVMLIIPIKSTLIPDCNTTICRKVQGGYFIYIYIYGLMQGCVNLSVLWVRSYYSEQKSWWSLPLTTFSISLFLSLSLSCSTVAFPSDGNDWQRDKPPSYTWPAYWSCSLRKREMRVQAAMTKKKMSKGKRGSDFMEHWSKTGWQILSGESTGWPEPH